MATLLSYDLLGTKESVADWISNISPEDTPFVSFTGKAPVHNTLFNWQYDDLETVDTKNAFNEDTFPDFNGHGTYVASNQTQILRKVVKVSDTADAINSHGRPSELDYQMEKASREMKRDLEAILLSAQGSSDGSVDGIRRTAGFYNLVAPLNFADPKTGAVVHKEVQLSNLKDKDIFDITENLYMAGSRANTIMFHPMYMKLFSDMKEEGDLTPGEDWNYVEDRDYTVDIWTIRDPLGQTYNLIPNRLMNPSAIYFFHPHDWFQRVLRAPDYARLSKEGSYEEYMLEMEVGLQHRNPFASGILDLSYNLGSSMVTVLPQGDLSVLSSPVNMHYTITNDPGLPPTKVEWEIVTPNSYSSINPNTGVLSFTGVGPVDVKVKLIYMRGDSIEGVTTVNIVPPAYDFSIDHIPDMWEKSTTAEQVNIQQILGTPLAVTYSVSDAMASITQTGLLRVYSAGTFDVIVTCDYPFGVSVTHNMTVNSVPTAFSDSSIVTVDVVRGESIPLAAYSILTPNEANSLGVTYQYDSNYVTVDNDGTLHGVAETPSMNTTTVTIKSKADTTVSKDVLVHVNTRSHTVTITTKPVAENSMIGLYEGDDLEFDIVLDSIPDGEPLVLFLDPSLVENESMTKVSDTHYKYTAKAKHQDGVSFNSTTVGVGVLWADGSFNTVYNVSVINYLVAFDEDTIADTYETALGTILVETIPFTNDNGNPYPVTFTSSDPSVLDIDTAGNYTAKTPGTVTITAEVDFGTLTKTISTQMTVNQILIRWKPGYAPVSGPIGSNQVIDAELIPTSTPYVNKTFESSDPSVVAVDGAGVMEYISSGTVIIQATFDLGNGFTKHVRSPVTIKGGQLGIILRDYPQKFAVYEEQIEMSIFTDRAVSPTATSTVDVLAYPDQSVSFGTGTVDIDVNQVHVNFNVPPSATSGLKYKIRVTIDEDGDIYTAETPLFNYFEWIQIVTPVDSSGMPTKTTWATQGAGTANAVSSSDCYIKTSDPKIFYRFDEIPDTPRITTDYLQTNYGHLTDINKYITITPNRGSNVFDAFYINPMCGFGGVNDFFICYLGLEDRLSPNIRQSRLRIKLGAPFGVTVAFQTPSDYRSLRVQDTCTVLLDASFRNYKFLTQPTADGFPNAGLYTVMKPTVKQDWNNSTKCTFVFTAQKVDPDTGMTLPAGLPQWGAWDFNFVIEGNTSVRIIQPFLVSDI